VVAPVVAAAGEVVDGTTAVGTTHPFDAPAGIVNGSLLVAVYTVEHSSSGTLLAAPTGWAKAPDSDGAFQAVGSGTALYVFYKIVTDAGSEPVEYDLPAQDDRWVRGAVLRISGHDEAAPWDGGDGAVLASNTSCPSVAVTTTGADRLVLWAGSSYNLSAWSTMPTGFTEHATYASASSETTTLATMEQASAATITTGTIATGASAGKAAWIGAIRPAGGTGVVSGTAVVTLGALSVAGDAGPQLKTGTSVTTLGALSAVVVGTRTTWGSSATTLGTLSVLARQLKTGTATVTLGALSVAAVGTIDLPPPGQIFDLSRVHLTLPTDDGSGSAEQIDQPELATYEDEHFFTTAEGRMRFVAPVDGATTSGASGATRAELRAHEEDYDEEAFDPHTTGRRQVTLTTRVDATNISGGSNPRKEAIFFQIHGAGDSPIPLILSAEYHVATPRVRIFKNGPGLTNPVTGITPTTDITVRCRVENATVRLWVIAGQVADLPPVGDTAPYEWPASDFTDDEGWYYKPGGIYNKTQISSGSTGESSAEVSFLEILQPGDPDPEGHVTGTAAVSLGALSATATGRRIVVGTVSVPLGAPTVVAAGDRVVPGQTTVTLGALQIAATGTVVAEVVTGSAALPLGALSVAAAGTRTTWGDAGVILGALQVTAFGPTTVTGAATVSLGAVSVTAVGTVVAEVVAGTAAVALVGPSITAVGSRATSGLAVVALPSLVLTVLGEAVDSVIRAGTPTAVRGPTADTPTPRTGPLAATPTARSGLVASTPTAR
jgi:hypothetical protein